jgi:hypothetical protein
MEWCYQSTFQGVNRESMERAEAPSLEEAPIPNFDLDKNTPERKDCIMGRLVVPVEV